MANPTANLNRGLALDNLPVFITLPVAAATHLFEGEAAGMAAGYVAPPSGSSRPFAGLVQEEVDNSAGSAGDLNVRLCLRGRVIVPVTGASAVTDVGANVYVTDGNTWTLTGTSAALAGRVTRWISSTLCEVAFCARSLDLVGVGQTAVPDLTDSTGGSATTTLAAITAGASYAQADLTAIKNGLATLAADTALIKAALRSAGILLK